MDLVNIKPRYINKLDQITGLSEADKLELKPVAEKFAFRTNDYYQSLIDWNDPHDPIRRIVMPDIQELDEFGELDASNELSYTVVKGLEHKYQDTALLLVNNVCGAYCRFCFRKRLFTDGNDEVTNDISDAVAYIEEHPEINNVLLSGGDPLIMSIVSFAPRGMWRIMPACTSLTVVAPPPCVTRNVPAPSQTITVSRPGR